MGGGYIYETFTGQGREALTQPTVTTGLLEVVRSSIKYYDAAGEAYADQLDKKKVKAERTAGAEFLEAVGNLPPEVRALVMGGEG